MTDEEFESHIHRFEQAWRFDGPPEIGDYLGDLARGPDPERFRLFVELICIDLEYRWRDPQTVRRATLADYVEKHPELIALDRLPVELIGEEYRVRCRWGDRPSHAEFLSRFGQRAERIRAELLRVDREMELEVARPSDTQRPDRQSPSREEQAELDPDIPLLSHREFLLRRLIGAGRMGKVYEAREHATGRGVAVKFLRKSLLHHRDVVRRFIDEPGRSPGSVTRISSVRGGSAAPPVVPTSS